MPKTKKTYCRFACKKHTTHKVIPNKEVREVFKLQIQEWFKKSIFSNTEQLQNFWKAFAEGNTEEIEKYLNKILSNSVSVFDTRAKREEKESSYHNLLVGILTGKGWPSIVSGQTAVHARTILWKKLKNTTKTHKIPLPHHAT